MVKFQGLSSSSEGNTLNHEQIIYVNASPQVARRTGLAILDHVNAINGLGLFQNTFMGLSGEVTTILISHAHNLKAQPMGDLRV